MYKEIANKINEADAILIGASNGFSITEGIHLFANNQALHDLFSDYIEKYGLPNLLTGMLGQWPTINEMWGFWSRMVNHYYNNYHTSTAMKDLMDIVGDKDYFILTSNGEMHFEKAGFNDDKVYEIEGDWIHMQCSHGCHQKRYEWSTLAKNMVEKQKDGKVPDDLIPVCPHCGEYMIPNMAAGHHFIMKPAIDEKYKHFINQYHGKKLVILELGIGKRNTLIKAPLMELTRQEEHATYITINLGEVYILDEIKNKSYGIDNYLDQALKEIKDNVIRNR